MNKIFTSLRKTANYILGSVDSRPIPVFILCYHGFSRSSYEHDITLSEFKKQIEYLSKHVNFVSLDDIAAYVQGHKLLPNPAVAITFDDGYRSLLKVRSIIKQYFITPTAFVLSNHQTPNRLELANQHPLLNIKEVRSLIKDGWDIGLHSATHPNLSELSHQELNEEILLAKKELEDKLGQKVKYFAYPKGRYNEEAKRIVREAGLDAAFSMDDNSIDIGCDVYTISRIGINNSHSITEFPTLFTPLVQKLRRLIK